MLERGLAAWRALPAADREKPPQTTAPKHRFEWQWPTDGLVLTQTMRYLPDHDDAAATPEPYSNHDHAWFTAAEARQLFAAAPRVGAEHTVPPALFERLARFHLVDAVRGETRSFDAAEVAGALRTTIGAVRGGLIDVELRGSSRATRGARPRGPGRWATAISAQLLGRARYDLDKAQFVAFELVAKGERVQLRSRRRGHQRQRPIGWHFALTPPDAAASRIAPTHIREYGGRWSAGRR